MTPRQANQAAYKYGVEIENKLKRGGTIQYESITFNQFAEMYFKDMEELEVIADRWAHYDETGELDWWLVKGPQFYLHNT